MNNFPHLKFKWGGVASSGWFSVGKKRFFC